MSPFVTSSCPRDHATEGAIIGAAVLGVGGLALGYAIRGNGSGSSPRLGEAAGVGALLALAGAIAGALIGGAIDDTESPPDTW